MTILLDHRRLKHGGWLCVLVAGIIIGRLLAGLPVVSISAAADELASPPPLVDPLFLHAIPALPPIGHSRFCLRYPNDCEIHGIDFRRRKLTLKRARELNIINRTVNREIAPNLSVHSAANEEWLIWPPAGDCKNYAITKRHELLARGWPSRALLLSEVVVSSGQHHLVLIVRLKDADLVLDNLDDDIRPIATTYGQYHWVRIQSPQNPRFWAGVRMANTALGRQYVLDKMD